MKELAGKKLLVLGGAQFSCEIIETAQAMGAVVYVTDYNKPKDSPGKQIADKSFMVSTTDVDAVVNLIRQEKVDGVIVGFVDMLLPYYAEICEKSGLPCYGDKALFDLFINKNRYKKKLREYGIPTIEDYSEADWSLESTAADLKYPLLIKPADSSGARGITICYDADEFSDAVKKARCLSKSEEVLVEQYLDAPEVTLFWLFSNGKCYLTDIGNRHIKSSQTGVIPLPVGYTYPSAILPIFRSDLEKKYKKMFRDLGVKNGMMFVQCKLEHDKCIAYDIGYRLTGSLEYHHMERIYGFNPMKMMIRFALTGKMGEETQLKHFDPAHKQKAFNITCLAKPGKIKALNGCDKIKQMPEVEHIFISHFPGDSISEEMKGLLAQATIRILGVTEDESSLESVIERIESNISIISENGEEMKLPGIDPSEIKSRLM